MGKDTVQIEEKKGGEREKTGMAILILDKINFKQKCHYR